MQNADAECRMRVPPMRVSTVVRFRLSVGVSVDVNMDVSFSAVFVLVFMHLILERLAQSPETDSKKHHAHESFTPGGKPIGRNQVSQPERKQTNDCDTG